MADKATYLSDLAALSYIQEVGTPVENQNAGDTELDLKVYVVNVLEKVGTEKAQKVRHLFSVYNEGGAQETAFGPYDVVFKDNDSVYQAIVSYVESISNVKSYWIKEYDKEKNFAKVRINQHVTDHIEEKWILIWKDGTLTHEEITTTV